MPSVSRGSKQTKTTEDGKKPHVTRLQRSLDGIMVSGVRGCGGASQAGRREGCGNSSDEL